MKIYSRQGSEKADITPNEGSKWRKELMAEEYVLLKFTSKKFIAIAKGDYIVADFGTYYIVDLTRPKWNTTSGAWDYELKFHAEWMKWQNRTFFFNRQQGNKEKAWQLTQFIGYFLDLLVDNISQAGFGDNWLYAIDDDTLNTTVKCISFDGVSILDGLNTICETWETEWWIEGRTIHIGKCEFGTSVKFEIGELLNDMTASESNGTYANRLYAFGSTRNIPTNYRGELSQATIEGIVEKRLMLPEGTDYVDAIPNMNNDDVVEGIVVFDDIYPRNTATMTAVSTKEYTDSIENEDGTETSEKWNAYRYKDASVQFKSEYVIAGEELRIVFQTGLLAGCDFAVAFNPDALSDETSADAQTWEIIRNEDYGIPLPNETLRPNDGDTFILYGFNASLVNTQYTADAEMELLEKTVEKAADMVRDDKTYSCVTDPVRCSGWRHSKEKGMTFNAADITDLDVGQSVQLVNEAYFAEPRTSRVRAFEKDLNNIYVCTYEVGESAKYSYFNRKSNVNVSTVTYNGKTYVGVNGGSTSAPGTSGGRTNLYVIKRQDNTQATDYNVYSAARALVEFVSRTKDDTVNGNITFNKNITVKEIGRIVGGAMFGEFIRGLKGAEIDKEGNTELNELIVRVKAVLKELQVNDTAQFDGELVSTEFRSGFVDGFGWRIGKEEVANALGIPETKYTAEFDNIIIRGAMRVFELIVSQMLGENDNRIFTAMMEVDHYDPTTGKVWLDTRNGKLYNPFRVGDYIMVQQYNGMPSEENQHYITKHYECIITDVGMGGADDGENRLDWVKFKNFVSPIDDTAANLISKGDTFCRVDNETDEDRKGIIQIMTVGSATPYMDVVKGLKTDPDNALKGRLGNLEGIYHHLFGQLQGFGELLMNLYAVGDFRLSQTGESVQARFEMLKNVFATRFTKQTNEVTEADNFLTNGTFGENMEGWTPNPEEDTRFLTLADGTPILVNDTTQTTAQHRVGIDEYDGKQMLHIIDSGITQANALIKQPGTHKEYLAATAEDETTQQKYDEVQDTMYISIRMLSKRTGTLDIGFKGAADVEGKENTLPFTQGLTVEKGYNWQTLQFEGKWNGTGDFYIAYTGEAYISLVSVTTQPLDNYKKTTETRILQDDSNILLLGTRIDKTNKSLTELGIELRAEDGQIRLYVDTKTEELNRSLGITIDEKTAAVKLYAEQYVSSSLKGYYTRSEIDTTVEGIFATVTKLNTETDAALKKLQDQIDAANAAIDEAKEAAQAVRDYVDGAFADGIVSEAEKIAIEKHLNTIAGTKNSIDATYLQLCANTYLTGTTALQKLQEAKSAFNSAYTNLRTVIDNTIYDGIATTDEIRNVNNAFDTYNSALSTISTAIENANKAIQDYLKTYGEQLKQEAINYANSINVAETYEQSTNPWNTWTSDTEYKHIGAMWKYTGANDGVNIYNRNGNKIGAINGHTYRYVGWTGNYWEDVSDVAATVAFWNNYGDVLMGAATNFDKDGNITQQGGLRISAFGNTLWVQDGDLISKITQYANGICLSALNITLKGYISNGNGSFAVDENGNVSMKDALINGTLRTPFILATDNVIDPWNTSTTTKSPCAKDNVYYKTSGSITLNWNTRDSGRRITIIHGKDYATNYCEIKAPTGYYFWENGVTKDTIRISRQMAVLKGYGDENNFFGYIVELRQDINTGDTYGAPMKTICMGKLTVSTVASGNTPSINLSVRCYDKKTASSFSVTRSGTGIYKIYLPGTWYIKPDDILVQTTGFGKALNSATQYAETIVFSNVTSIGSTLRYNPNLKLTDTYVQYIEFRTADDSSLNDGSFFFQISNMSDLDWL